VALAGLGTAAVRGHLPALQRLQSEGRLTLAGAADPDASRRAVLSGELRGVPVFDSTEEMLATIRSDLLVIATEPSAHAALTLLGVRHRQHVLCEKPLTVAREHQTLVASAYAREPELGLVGVHQYRYSATWTSMSRFARLVDRLGMPFELVVDVQRNGTDPHAASPWRRDIGASGGMLADHGVHFLALGRTINDDFQVLHTLRAWHEDGERSVARVRFGTGVLELSVSARARARCTRAELHVAAFQLSWCDASVRLLVGRRTVARWRTDALSDRGHVDRLYLPLYRDLVEHLHEASWRKRHTAEALAVGAGLVALLELAAGHVAV
jgi:predicted dehydrogenase